MLILLVPLVIGAIGASCSSSAPAAFLDPSRDVIDFSDEELELMAEQARLIHELENTSFEDLKARNAQANAAHAERREAAQPLIDEVMADWEIQPCPVGGSVSEAFFDPRTDAATDLDLDLSPYEGWSGYEIVRVADLVLSNGLLLESGGEWIGEGGTPIPIAAPGTYPLFMALSRHGGAQGVDPAMTQLVLDPTSPPIRWEDDERFGFGTNAGMGWIGSPEAIPFPEPDAADEIARIAWITVDAMMFEAMTGESVCTTWERDDGANFVIYSNGLVDGFTPAAAGYDADGRLVAITWFFSRGPWVLAGIPGVPPQPVLDQIDCRRAALSDGLDPDAC